MHASFAWRRDAAPRLSTRRLAARALVLLALVALVATGAFASGERPPYLIGPGDRLDVFLLEEGAAPISCLVRPDGMITLPYVGDVAAAGRTPAELREAINEAAKMIREEPNVTLAVREISSYRIYILGKVGAQGPIESIEPLRLLQAIASAGGLSEFASGEVIVMREGPEGRQRIEIDVDDIIKGRAPESDIWLRSRDVVYAE